MIASVQEKYPARAPVTIIEPRRGWAQIPWRELWERREVFLLLAGRDLTVRYKQTFIGVAWAVLQPLFTMIMFSLFFGRLAKMPSEGLPYPVFAFLGLLPWTLFTNVVTSSANSLISNAALLTKVYIPRLIIPSATALVAAVDALLALALLLVLMIGYGVPLQPGLLIIPLLLAVTGAFALGVGLILSAANAKYRDVRYIVPFALQIGMFASPIIYPSSLVPERFRLLYALNPLVTIIDTIRAAARGEALPWGSLAMATILAGSALALGAAVFRRFEQELIDTV